MPVKFKLNPSNFAALDNNTATVDELVKRVISIYDFLVENYLKDENYISESLAKEISIFVNWRAINSAAGHARIDLLRWGVYHLSNEENPQLDRHKYAGFLSKWIAKVRPIHVEADPSVDLSPALCRLNAFFAFLIFRSYLILGDSDSAALEKIEDEVLYRFHYRDETGENLAFIAYCYEEASKFMPRSEGGVSQSEGIRERGI